MVGHVRRFNDYPCINMSRPAFSQRAVDLLRDVLEPNGEPLMIFPEYRSGDIVRPHHLLAMRRLLVEKGYMAPDDFARFLAQRESA